MLNNIQDIMEFLNSQPMKEINTLRNDTPEELAPLSQTSSDMYNSNNLNNPFQIVSSRNKKNEKEYFYNLLHMGVFGAAKATKYNLDTFLHYCNFIEDKASEARAHLKTPGGAISIVADKLIFEYEHFTLHSRILLDRINWFLNYFFMTDAGNLYKLYKIISITKGIGKEIADIIDSNRDFLDELISSDKSSRRTERDFLAHRNEIQFTVVNLHFYPSGETKVFLPTKGDIQMQADLALINRYNNLMKFTYEILNTFLNYNFTV